jgi:methylphosphotriester-DNA--protein-cysteine methyltransferase
MSYQQWRLMRAIELLATGRSIGYTAFDQRFASDSTFIAFSKDMIGSPRAPGPSNHLTTGNRNQLPQNITCVILHA